MKKYRPIGWGKILKDIQDSRCFYVSFKNYHYYT